MIKYTILMTVFTGFFSTMLYADPAEDLIRELEKIKTFSAQFEQKIHDANGQHVSKSKGEMVVHRPGKFYWKSQSPDPVLVIADGKTLWTYDMDLSQVTKQNQKEAFGNSPATLLAGDILELKNKFSIVKDNQKYCQHAEQCYLLKPLQEDANFADIVISFNQGNLTKIQMHDSLGQEINTLFTQVKINSAVNNKLFAFKPPKGVDIIKAGK